MTSRLPTGYIHVMRNHQIHRHAFSLVELSIVLVILGLLVGGILAGQSLIRAAELRSVITDLNKYRTALFAFRDKYFGLPGDITNATAFWGDQATGTGACASAATADGTPGTCNGDANGKIDSSTESPRAWQHLAMAGLIEGTYPGTGGLATAGVMPSARLTNGAFNIYASDANGNTSATNPNRFIIGALNSSGGTTSNALLKPEEMWNIDTKLDDGLPDAGKLRAATGNVASGICKASSAYSLSNSGIACYFSYTTE